MLQLPYTLCFCLCTDQVLLLHRTNPPNKNLWNGLGGKIEPGETPLQNISREMMEEAEINLAQAQHLHFTGLVTWTMLDTPTLPTRGMYVFLARFASDFPRCPDCPTREGLLSWKPLIWACDHTNPAIVSNIPHFLPSMLNDPQPRLYACTYQGGSIQAMVSSALPPDVSTIIPETLIR